MFDKQEMIFGSKVLSVVMKKLNASVQGEECEKFIEELYSKFKTAGSPKDIEQWIFDNIKDQFQFIDTPPNWVEDEPNWPFMNAKPMIFIGQHDIRAGKVADNQLDSGITLYLFGARIPYKDGFKLEYVTVSQRKIFSAH
jgi:hypothetical protein